MLLRSTNIKALRDHELDVLIIGGGINGAVSAAALAAKGAKIGLIDRGDFAGHSSSASSNLAWGGIKYLETHEYGLVNKLCRSRNQLMTHYPSTVKEIRFLTTLNKGFRFPVWMVYAGTLLYWIIGRFFTQPPNWLSVKNIKKRESVINVDNAKGGFEYSDCYLKDNDSRFVFNFIRRAMDLGAHVANYVSSLGSKKEGGLWYTDVQCEESLQRFTIKSKVLINATGAYVDELNKLNGIRTQYKHLFSKGIHLIVDRITESEKVLTFFASDGRLFFVIPMGNKTCIGTTDSQIDQPKAIVTNEDRKFVLDNANACLSLSRPLTTDDIISERCGVRPLASELTQKKADWVKLSRKHQIDADLEINHISIFGGKLTDCINVGEEVSNDVLNMGINLNAKSMKWFGEPDRSLYKEFKLQADRMDLDGLTPVSSSELLSSRLWRRYGDDALELLEAIRENPREAELLIDHSEYLRCEIKLAAKREMITRLSDFLRRRSKIEQVVRTEDLLKSRGLKEASEILFGKEGESKLEQYINGNPTTENLPLTH